MAEYIEREALKEWLYETMSAQTTTVGMAYVRDFWNKVLDTPAADVAPVVHGRWDAKIMKDIGTYTVYWCSKCNCCSYFKHKYCPHCGARMDDKA